MKNTPHFSILIALTLALIAFACSSSASVDPVAEATETFGRGDIASASEMASSLSKPEALEKLSTDQICRLCLLLTDLSEANSAPEENMARAARCLSFASEKDADSVHEFIQTLPIDERSRMDLVDKLCSGAEIHNSDIKDIYEAHD